MELLQHFDCKYFDMFYDDDECFCLVQDCFLSFTQCNDCMLYEKKESKKEVDKI